MTKHGQDAIKRKDASVVKKGSGPAVPNQHWEMPIGNSVFPVGSAKDPFLARRGQDRPQPHNKINECDH